MTASAWPDVRLAGVAAGTWLAAVAALHAGTPTAVGLAGGAALSAVLVWIAPVVAPLIALFLIWEVVRRWRRRVALAPAGGPAISPELLDRARREAGSHSDE